VSGSDWIPPDVDLSRPNAARIYDYYLGGAHNFAIDREFARRALEAFPDARAGSWLNRQFLGRTVRFCLNQGIRQFLDIGSGIPTVGHTHEIAQTSAPEAKVVYVDNEAVAFAHSQLILADNPNATTLRADARRPKDILFADETRSMLDFDQPIALLMLTLLHFIANRENPLALLAEYRDAVTPGSYLVLSHVSADLHPTEMNQFAALYEDTNNPVTLRTRAEFAELFDGWELIEPGVSQLAFWNPSDADPPLPIGWEFANETGYGAVAIKR